MAQVPTAGSANHSTTTYTGSKFPFDIYVTPECLVKMNEYGRAAQPTEIGGLARLEINKETKNIFVTDIHIFPQAAEACYFEIPVEAMNAWTLEMVKAGRGDELSEWKSIFHTHPIGMAPSMSGHDVDQIMNFAQEGDAFSFILSASATAASERMFMHYCCNMYGEKYVIRDIPVKTSLSSDRLTLCDQLTKYLVKKLGGSAALDDSDVEKLDGLVTEFLTKKVPMYFEQGRNAVRAAIEEHTESVLVRRTTVFDTDKKSTGYTPRVGEYAAGAQKVKQQHAIENDAMVAMVQDAVHRGEMSESDGQEYINQLLSEEEQEYIGYTSGAGRVPTSFEKEQDIIHHLFGMAFDRYDSNRPSEQVSKKRSKKAARMWELRVQQLNEKIRKETDEGIGLYDMVLVDYSKVSTNKTNKQDTDLDKVPHPVEVFIHDRTGFSFEVAGELFWAHELKVVQRFEEKMEEIRGREQERRELARAEGEQATKAKMQEASQALDEALVNGPGDTTSTELVTTK